MLNLKLALTYINENLLISPEIQHKLFCKLMDKGLSIAKGMLY